MAILQIIENVRGNCSNMVGGACVICDAELGIFHLLLAIGYFDCSFHTLFSFLFNTTVGVRYFGHSPAMSNEACLAVWQCFFIYMYWSSEKWFILVHFIYFRIHDSCVVYWLFYYIVIHFNICIEPLNPNVISGFILLDLQKVTHFYQTRWFLPTWAQLKVG